VISLNGTQVTDVGAQALAVLCSNLTGIELTDTQVADVGAHEALAVSCPNLTEIDLDNTRVTIGWKQTRAARPNLRIS